MNVLTQNKLKELLYYSPQSGLFVWRKTVCSKAIAGDIAGTLTPSGYIKIMIDGKLYRAHRLVFLYMYGLFPTHEVDHINGVRSNNAIGNLRQATRVENARNQKKSVKNTSGIIGVTWNAATNKWRSQIMVASKNIYTGTFFNFFDACCARKSAELVHGFHKNHGRKI